MTPKIENTYLKVISSFLLGGLISLGAYTYTQDKEGVGGDLHSVKQDIISVEETDKHLIEKMYNLIIISNEKISDLKESDARTIGQYEVLSLKFDNMAKTSAEDRELFLKKLENHEDRLVKLEKTEQLIVRDLSTIMKDKGLTLFEWKN